MKEVQVCGQRPQFRKDSRTKKDIKARLRKAKAAFASSAKSERQVIQPKTKIHLCNSNIQSWFNDGTRHLLAC